MVRRMIAMAAMMTALTTPVALAQTQREGQTVGAGAPIHFEDFDADSPPSSAGSDQAAQSTCDSQADKQKLRGKKRKSFLEKCSASQ